METSQTGLIKPADAVLGSQAGLAKLSDVLLRIQEQEHSVDYPNEPSKKASETLREESFRSLIHLKPQTSATVEPSVEDCMSQGLQDCHILLGAENKTRLTPQFCGALLYWALLPDRKDQFSILKGIDTAKLLFAYVLAIHWAHQELGPGDHRTHYRTILHRLQPQLDELISTYPTRNRQKPSLLLEFKSLVSTLDDKIDIKADVATKVAGSAVLRILGLIVASDPTSEAGRLPYSHWNFFTKLIGITKLTPQTQPPPPTLHVRSREFDREPLPWISALLVYINLCQEHEHQPNFVVRQYLADCEVFLSSNDHRLPRGADSHDMLLATKRLAETASNTMKSTINYHLGTSLRPDDENRNDSRRSFTTAHLGSAGSHYLSDSD